MTRKPTRRDVAMFLTEAAEMLDAAGRAFARLPAGERAKMPTFGQHVAGAEVEIDCAGDTLGKLEPRSERSRWARHRTRSREELTAGNGGAATSYPTTGIGGGGGSVR